MRTPVASHATFQPADKSRCHVSSPDFSAILYFFYPSHECLKHACVYVSRRIFKSLRILNKGLFRLFRRKRDGQEVKVSNGSVRQMHRNASSEYGSLLPHRECVSIRWQRALEPMKTSSDLQERSTGLGARRGRERARVRGCVHGFHGKSSAFNGGYVAVTQRSIVLRMPPAVSR